MKILRKDAKALPKEFAGYFYPMNKFYLVEDGFWWLITNYYDKIKRLKTIQLIKLLPSEQHLGYEGLFFDIERMILSTTPSKWFPYKLVGGFRDYHNAKLKNEVSTYGNSKRRICQKLLILYLTYLKRHEDKDIEAKTLYVHLIKEIDKCK